MKNFLILLSLTIIFGCGNNNEKLEIQKRITEGETVLLNDSSRQLNLVLSEKVLKDYINFADAYKDDSLSQEYLFKAGDLAHGLGKAQEAIQIFERLQREYP